MHSTDDRTIAHEGQEVDCREEHEEEDLPLPGAREAQEDEASDGAGVVGGFHESVSCERTSTYQMIGYRSMRTQIYMLTILGKLMKT